MSAAASDSDSKFSGGNSGLACSIKNWQQQNSVLCQRLPVASKEELGILKGRIAGRIAGGPLVGPLGEHSGPTSGHTSDPTSGPTSDPTPGPTSGHQMIALAMPAAAIDSDSNVSGSNGGLEHIVINW
jgi:hypothetical protein